MCLGIEKDQERKKKTDASDLDFEKELQIWGSRKIERGRKRYPERDRGKSPTETQPKPNSLTTVRRREAA